MRAILLVAAVLLFPATLFAQRFSAGARIGVGAWTGYYYAGNVNRTKTWEKELFFRWEKGQHVAFELGAFTEAGPSKVFSGGIDTFRPVSHLRQDYRNSFYGLNIRVQYGFTPGHSKAWKNYLGIAFAPAIEDSRYDAVDYHEATNDTVVLNHDFRITGWQSSIEDMIRCRISKHFSAHLLLDYRVAAFKQPGDVGNGWLAQLGAAYAF